MYYILKDKTPVNVDFEHYLKWWQVIGQVHVDKTTLIGQNGEEIIVSTVFLGLSHSRNTEKPLLFETMIFGGKHDQYQERHCTYQEAEAGHKKAVELVTGGAQYYQTTKQ